MNVVVYTRRACPLCADGITKAVHVFGSEHVRLVDIDQNPELLDRYTDRVPVIEAEGGGVVDEGSIDTARLVAFRGSHPTSRAH